MSAAVTSAAPPPPPPPPAVVASAQPPKRTPPRWGTQTSLIQRHQPAFWVFVGILVLGVTWGIWHYQLRAIDRAFAGWLLSWVLLLLYLVPAVLIIRWLDSYEREPRSMLIGAFLWGFFGATLFAPFGNQYYGIIITKLFGAEFAANWSPALTAPLVEESYKYIGLVLLFLIARTEIDDLLDGFVYGAMIGLGFAVAEDIYYFVFVGGGSIIAVILMFLLRVVLSGLYSHYLFTGLAGIGLAYFVSRRGEQPLGRRVLVAGGLLLLAMSAHFVWNSPIFNEQGLMAVLVWKGLPFLIALILLLRLARKRENDTLALLLAGETDKVGLTPRELELLHDRKSRRRAQKRVGQVAGFAAAEVMKKLQQEQIKLAMVATAVESPDDVALVRQRTVCQALRAQLWQYPGAAATLGETTDPEKPLPLNVSDQFLPNTAVIQGGAWAVPTPDWNDPRRLALPAGLPVQVVEERTPWVLARTANSWFGWTDQRWLEGNSSSGAAAGA